MKIKNTMFILQNYRCEVKNLNKISLFLFFIIIVLSYDSKGQCTSNATSTADEEILNVTFGTINNTSSCASTGGAGSILNEYSNYAYVGFPGGVPNVDRGCVIPFSIQIGTCGGNYGNSVAIYIDWNNDLDFIDAGENVYLSAASTTGPHTETGNITIPITATLGNCHMRIVNVETTPAGITPCGTYSWGETEDYFINVTNGGGVAPYVSSNVNQIVSGSVSQCANFQQIISIPIVMGAGCTAGSITQFLLGAGSSTNLLADVSKIHIYFTGTSNSFLAINEFVVGGTIPTGASNTINGSQTLIANATNYFWVAYDMNPLSTIGNLIDGSCSQVTISGITHVPTVSNPAGNGVISICPCSFSLGADVALCAPISYTINGPAGYDSYIWSPGGAVTQNLGVTATGNYTCTATIINGGLVVNGDFSSGNTGFTSNYVLGGGGAWGPLSNPGSYSVTTNPNLAHTNFYSFGDHTTGTGNMMVCNGSSIANDIAWSQTITVTANTNYNFSAWMASTENTSAGSEAQLQFSINGVLIGSVTSAPLTGGTWANFFVNWNSGTSTSAVIKIVDQNVSGGANDFVLDDITFERICVYSDVIAITANSSPTVTVPSNVIACNSNSIASLSFTSTPAGATFTWTNSNTSIGLAANGTSNTPTFVGTNSGTTAITSVITVTPSFGSCIGTPKTFTITINPSPTLTTSATNSIICLGNSTSLNGSGASTYTWSSGVTNGLAFSPTTTATYTVTGTSVSGCTNTAVQTITVNSLPIITVNNPTICPGSTATLTANGATTYSWNTTATTQSITDAPIINTIYTVTGTTNGCSSSNTSTVSISSAIVISVNNPTVCNGTSAILTANGVSSYTWSPSATLSSPNGSIVTANPTVTTIYSLFGTIGTCTASGSSTVIVNTNPTVTANTSNSVICIGNSTSLSGGGASTYTWSSGITNGVVFSPTTTATYTVSGTSITGCTNTAVQTITVNSLPIITVNNPTICPGSTATLTANGATTYSWNTTATTQSITDAPIINTTYTVTGTTNGCSSSNTSTVSISSAIVISVNNPTVCNGTSTILTANGVSSYTWSPSSTLSSPNGSVVTANPTVTTIYSILGTIGTCTASGSSTITVNSNPTVTAITSNSVICIGNSTSLTGGGASTYTWSSGVINGAVFSPTTNATYTVTGTSVAGCTNTAVQTITVNSLPIITVNNATVCFGTNALLTANGATSYTWSNAATTATVNVSPIVNTVYTVTGTNNGCSSSNTSTVSVSFIPTIALSNPTICSGSSAQITSTVSIIGGNYTWLPGNQNTSSISVSPSTTTNYSLSYSVNGCSVTATNTVNVNTTPTVSINTATMCNGQSASLIATPSLAGGTFLWTPNGQNTASILESPTNSSPYSVLYSLNGCTVIATGSITVYQIPVVTLTPSSYSITSLEDVTISATGGGSYNWITGQTTSLISVNPQNTSNYCVTVTSPEGCINSNCINIVVIDESTLYIPNVFTPNGDGTNDIYFTPGHNIVTYDLNIFNRWGQIIFSSVDPMKGWDGTFNGTIVPDGVYIYILKAKGGDNKNYEHAGHITVLK